MKLNCHILICEIIFVMNMSVDATHMAREV